MGRKRKPSGLCASGSARRVLKRPVIYQINTEGVAKRCNTDGQRPDCMQPARALGADQAADAELVFEAEPVGPVNKHGQLLATITSGCVRPVPERLRPLFLEAPFSDAVQPLCAKMERSTVIWSCPVHDPGTHAVGSAAFQQWQASGSGRRASCPHLANAPSCVSMHGALRM